jgi:hypothetical protein
MHSLGHEQPERNMRDSTLLKWAGYAGLVVAGGWALYRWSRHIAKQTDLRFRNEILTEAAGLLANTLGRPQDEILNAVRELVDTGQRAPAVERVMRIEYEIMKEDALKTKRTVTVAIAGSPGLRLLRSSREYRWEDLPGDLRSDLIRAPNERQIRCLVEAGDETPVSG